MSPHNSQEAYIRPDAFMEKFGNFREIFIPGKSNQNRAMNGDTVVVEILPESEWKSPSGVLAQKEQKDDEKEFVVEDDIKDISNKMPTGSI